ncbi:MAG: HNH endonuclease [Deltaproteobacteria bacterium]|jgi:hypothetical protein|nr:HNH endonuclease [Deltaproteobacteria bacterium]
MIVETTNGKLDGWKFKPEEDWPGRRRGGPKFLLDDDDKAFLLAHSDGLTYADIGERFLDVRGRPIGLSILKSFFSGQGIDRRRCHANRRPEFFLDDDDKAFLLAHSDGLTYADIGERFLAVRGRPIDLPILKSFFKEQGIDRRRCHVNQVYQPGQVITKSGYLNEKQADGSWEPCHRLIWRRDHGPIPAGCHVIFIDRDRTNLAPENLKLISREQFLYIKRFRFQWDNEDGLCRFLDAAAMEIESRRKEREGFAVAEGQPMRQAMPPMEARQDDMRPASIVDGPTVGWFDKLLQEATGPDKDKPAILSWLVKGCLEYQRQGGPHRPAPALKAGREYRDRNVCREYANRNGRRYLARQREKLASAHAKGPQ